MNAKLDFDATKLSEALKYQIHVAIDYCHTLEKHDVLWIEVFGDVTVEGRDQVEVKDYSDNLTDGHENFWNTLNNWLKPVFNHQQYANLILLTTQAYGERASLKNWAQLDAEQRLGALEAIHEAAEARFEKAKQSKDDGENEPDDEGADDGGSERKSAKPSKVLKLQRKVLATDIRESLLEALPKVKIVTEQPDLLGLISTYKMHYLKGIQPHRMDSFLDDLFGFMTSAIKITGGWRFTTAEFDKKFAELTARYLVGTLKFPRLNSDDVEMEAAGIDVRDRPFAMKLDEIGGDEELILQATADLLHAQQYIAELVKDCTTSQEDIEDYSKNQLRMHRSSRSSVMRKCDSTLTHAQLQKASCAFYDDRCAEAADRFSTYDFTPIEFRNGIYHMLADEKPASPLREFHWRLWK
ncbi:hypothetical protein [Pseudomonas borbori]|uniref:CD-NTase associated protein 4-like DNA endonuclease domain-containing protein n=1 Tax=Pseudomonas borbori TaxID=289003 RepID=A0A1I5WTE6_9PSED|nr:hypothetical protein [Pseudomonas borbori]SFQ22990.1 hypothetical protein SAMN05216190_1443 [Pseudomonas borbori]